MERKEITVKAKTVAEALELASAELGVPAAELDYVVNTEGKRGFLGIGAAEAEITASFVPVGEKNALDFIKTVVGDMELDAEITSRYNDEDALCIDVNGNSVG
ncbi:MAG: Jag N-terminal domain-containing protein, partial [Clostridia bacterium]|nr:Jag N-terminal domain-containing protein [Clostridia bacterium]